MSATVPSSKPLSESVQEALEAFKFERHHKQDFFYKYCTAGTAQKVFETSTFRWSSPLIFNDPFDNQSGMHVDFNIAEYTKMYFDRLEELVIADEAPVFDDFNKYSESILMLRDMSSTHGGFPKAKAIETMSPIVQGFAAKIIETHERLLTMWNRNLPRMRMFCMSDTFDNIQMWSHYADYHRGVVIKLKVAETAEEDDSLWLAQRVNYIPKALPLFTTAHIDESFGIKKFNPPSYDMFAYNKFDIWKDENEWRVFTLEDEPNDTYFNDYKFRFDKIHSIIFGCRCTDDDINKIKRIVVTKKNSIIFIKAIQHPYEYRLNFEIL